MFLNEDQIVKYQTDKIVLEFNDHMSSAPVESAANLHAGYSKIYVVAIDTSNGKGSNAVVVEANIDPIKMKCLYDKVKSIKHGAPQGAAQSSNDNQEMQLGLGVYKNCTATEALLKDKEKAIDSLKGLIEILQKNADKYAANKIKITQIENAIKAFQDGTLKAKEPPATNSNQQSMVLLYEKKISPNEKKKNENNEYPVTVLQIEYNPKMRNPFVISIENGWGQKEMQKNGGSSIKSGSYRSEKEIKKIVVDDAKFREMIRSVNDYIVNKELLFMWDLKDQVKKLKEEKRKQLETNRN